MLHVARQAGTAYNSSPIQHRRAVAAMALRGQYAPALRMWMDCSWSPWAASAGSVVSFMPDFSGQNVNINQATVAKRPVASTISDKTPTVQFDGVNDCLITPAVNLTNTAAITLITVSLETALTTGIIFEIGPGGAYNGFGYQFRVAGSGEISGGLYGNVGNSYKTSGGATNTWYTVATTLDQSQAAANEVSFYLNGVIPAFTSQGSVQNTSTFQNLAFNIGARNNGASLSLTGYIAAVLVLDRRVTPDETRQLTLLMQQRANLA